MSKKILYFDMDGVLVDFDGAVRELDERYRQEYEGRYDEVPGIFSKMKPIEGAIEAFNYLSDYFDVYILSTACWRNPTAWSDKLEWVKKYIGDKAEKRLILSHHKDLNRGDFLIDDREKNGAKSFMGEHILFGSEQFPDMKTTVEYLMSKK